MPATTTTKKAPKIRCPKCERTFAPKQALKAFHRNKATRTGFQTYCRSCAKEIDAAKKSAA